MDQFSYRRLGRAILAFACVLAIGTVGFRLLTEEGWVSSLYRSVVTTTLTGLDTKPEGAAAELFSIALLLSGVAVFLFIAGAVVEMITRGILGGTFSERKRRRTIEELRDHVIICGYGRVGRRIAAEFRATGTPFVVLDHNDHSVGVARADSALVVHGDATDDDTLEQAGLSTAKGLVVCVDSDEKSLFITLSARTSRPDLPIVSRASNESTARKLERAGASRVVQPYTTAGLQMANLVLKPQVTDFLDIVSTAGGPMPGLRFEEIVVTRECGQCGRTIRDLRLQETTGAIVVALRKADGVFDVTPSADAVFEEGDVVIAVGTLDEIARLEELFAPRAEAIVA